MKIVKTFAIAAWKRRHQ